MQPIHVNASAIVVAAIANFIFGALWYMPLFGKAWAAEMKMPMDGNKPPAGVLIKGMVLMLVGNLLTAHVLAHNSAAWMGVMPDATVIQFGFLGGFFTWLGFFLPQDLSRLAWENKSGKLFLINTVYHFLALQIVAMILSSWR
jgi:hypothetical protein